MKLDLALQKDLDALTIRVTALEKTVPTPVPAPASTLFAPTAFWNTPLVKVQRTNSAGLVAELNRQIVQSPPWINTTQYSTPLYIVNNAPKVPVTITNGAPYTALYKACQQGLPVPVGAIPANGTDGTMTIWDKQADILYEFWQFHKDAQGNYAATWGGIIQNVSKSDGVMPVTNGEYWGATATSLPAVGGTMLLSELKSGVIPHALAFAIIAPKQGSFVSPALRTDGWWTGANAISEGQRFYLPDGFKIDASWSPIIKMMVQAVITYGMVLRDKAGVVAFFAEDTTQYGGDQISQFFDGKQLWDVIKEFPFNSLVALQ